MHRRKWHDQWIKAAELASEMSTCASGRKVGAVFVQDNRILVSGFNGVPAKFPHPNTCARREAKLESGAGLDLCICNHAEMNGITNAARNGVSLLGATCYTTTEPCSMCMGLMANVGVWRVIFRDDYPSEKSKEIATHAGIVVVKYKPDNTTCVYNQGDSNE